MAEMEENQIRRIVQDELLGLIKDGQESLGLMKDPTGMGRKALEGLAALIRKRQSALGIGQQAEADESAKANE